MRKLVYLVVLATIFMFGCSKEKTKEQLSKNNQAKSIVRLITLSDGSRTSITMLEFSSTKAYDSILLNLRNQQDVLEDGFVSQYGYLNDSLLNEKEDEIGYTEQQAFLDFENSLHFTNSMRQAYVAAESAWLNHDTLDFANDPSNTYVFDNAEMAMLNIGGEVKIDTFLLKLTKDGFVEFTDGDFNKLVRFDNRDMSVLEEPNVVTNLDESSHSANCKSWKGENNYHGYSNKKRVKKHEHFHAYPWKGTSSARITSYKKRHHHWRRYRINLGVANQSYFFDKNYCDNLISQRWSGWKRKRRKSISKPVASWGAFPEYRAKNNASVVGYFEYAGFSNNNLLSW